VRRSTTRQARWYDKLQLLVFADGQAAINFEHAPQDGAQVVSLASHLAKAGEHEAGEHEAGGRGPAARAAPPRRLRFDVSPELGAKVEAARACAAAEAAALDLDTAMVRSVSAGWAKGRGVSLDGVVQLSFQLAHRRLTGGLSSTYEACSTQGFLHGRTEVIRPVTRESAALLQQLEEGDADAAGLRAALDAQRRLVADCQRGKGHGRGTASFLDLSWTFPGRLPRHGHERHLLALLVQAEEAGMPTPALFRDSGWATVTASLVSTSGLRSPALGWFAFGPVARQGVGLGYLLSPDGVALCATSFRGSGAPRAADLAAAVDEACTTLRGAVETLIPAPQPTSKL